VIDCNAVFIPLLTTESDGRVFSRGAAWCKSLEIPSVRLDPLLSTAVGLVLDCTDYMERINRQLSLCIVNANR
jgi:hypothetical protein